LTVNECRVSMSTSNNNWLLMFPNMSTGMKVQMIQNPPPTLTKPTLFRAILDLPYSERDKLIRSIPPLTLKSLILSLPKAEQQSFYKALSAATSSSSTTPKKVTSKRPSPCVRQKASDRDSTLQSALKLETSSSGYSFHGVASESNVGRQPRGRKRKRSDGRLSAKEGYLAMKEEVVAVMEYEDDIDRYPDRCAVHIDSGQFEREQFLPTMLKMMRASGDGPRPSRYSALILLNHVKAFLKRLIEVVDAAKTERTDKSSKSKAATMRMELEELAEWFPSQMAVFQKWKSMKFEAKKHDKKAPDLVNAASSKYDDELDGDGDGDGESMEEAMRRSAGVGVDGKDGGSVFLDDVHLAIGWEQRLIESDAMSDRMAMREYFRYSKCREAALTASPAAFWRWLKVKERHKFTRWCLNFIAWDRIGCIVQIARTLCGYGHGEIIQNEIDFLKPTHVVMAILRLNVERKLTPFPFKDPSFERIDCSKVPSIAETMKSLKGHQKECEIKGSVIKKASNGKGASKKRARNSDDVQNVQTIDHPIKKRKMG